MANKDFELQKQKWIGQNEQQYGEEVRQQHGHQSVMASYGKIKDMTEEQFAAANQLEIMLFNRLAEAMQDGTDELYLEIAELHKRWLSFYWPQYTKKAHAGLAQIYIADERYQKYYDEKIGDGATQLLYKSIMKYSEL